MREIKSRGKSYDDLEKWVYGVYVKSVEPDGKKRLVYIHYILTGAGQFFNGYWILKRVRVLRETVFHFTGIKDKNDVEIYEGDIVKIENDNLIVYFDEGTLIYCLKNKYGIHMGSLIGNGKIKVIGNIYENPELII